MLAYEPFFIVLNPGSLFILHIKHLILSAMSHSCLPVFHLYCDMFPVNLRLNELNSVALYTLHSYTQLEVTCVISAQTSDNQ